MILGLGLGLVLVLVGQIANIKIRQDQKQATSVGTPEHDPALPREREIRFRDATTGTIVVSEDEYKLAAQLASFITPERETE